MAGVLLIVLHPPRVPSTRRQAHAACFISRTKDTICSVSPCLCLLHLCRLKTVVCVKAEPLQSMNFLFYLFFSYRDDSHNSAERKSFPITRLFLKMCLAPAWKSWLKVVGCSGTHNTQRQTSWWISDRGGWEIIHPAAWEGLCTSLPDNWTLIYLNLMGNHMERNRKLI